MQEAVTAAVETLGVCREAGVAIFHLTGATRLRRRTGDEGIEGVIGKDGTVESPVNLEGLRQITVTSSRNVLKAGNQ